MSGAYAYNTYTHLDLTERPRRMCLYNTSGAVHAESTAARAAVEGYAGLVGVACRADLIGGVPAPLQAHDLLNIFVDVPHPVTKWLILARFSFRIK